MADYFSKSRDYAPSLSEMIDAAGATTPEEIYEVRRQREILTGEPMESDDLGEAEEEIVDIVLPGISGRFGL